MAIVVEIEIIFPIVDDDGYGGRIGSEWVAFAATAETNPPTIEEVQGKGILPPLEEGERYGEIRTREIPAI